MTEVKGVCCFRKQALYLHPGNTIELALVERTKVGWPQGREHWRAGPASCHGSIKWPGWGHAGELALVVWVRESCTPTCSATTQAQIHPASTSSVSHEGTSPADPKQDLHDTGNNR